MHPVRENATAVDLFAVTGWKLLIWPASVRNRAWQVRHGRTLSVRFLAVLGSLADVDSSIVQSKSYAVKPVVYTDMQVTFSNLCRSSAVQHM